MMKTLLDADYETRGDKAVIRLFYKTPEGRSIKEVNDFEPYFYALAKEGLDVLSGEVRALSGVVGTSLKNLLWKGEKTDVLRVVVSHPKEVSRLRDDVRHLSSCAGVYEADIPFARRYIIDSGITPMEHTDSIPLNVCAVDIEVYCPRGEPNPARDPVIMVSYADSGGLEKVLTYRSVEGFSADYVEVLENEAAVLRRFVELVAEREIDVITGYNSDNFDFPYIKERADKNRVRLEIGVDGREPRIERRGMNNGARVTGRPHVDVYPVARKVLNIPRYRLEDVYEAMFREEKVDIKVKDIMKFWDSGKPDEFGKLAEYSLSDVKATLAIALELLPLEYELSRVIMQPLYETSRTSSGQRVELLLMREAYGRGIMVPNRPGGEEFEERPSEAFTGAYVVDPKRGIHDNIVLFDFRSLYPSIIISHNVDPDTLNCGCCPVEENKSPVGHRFCTKTRGFIPTILEGLIKKRIEIKAKMKNASDEKLRRLLDVQQNAVKLLSNSMYGYYGFMRARWYCRECAESITAWGRDYIHKAMEYAEADGFQVIYGDTDSIYITKEGRDKAKIVEEAKAFQKRINKQLPEAMDLEFEGFYPRGIFITKKRYALMDEQGKLTVKGLETRRRDWCEKAKDTQKKVLDALLKDRDPDKAANIVKDVVAEIKSGQVPLKELVIHTQMTRSLGEYVNEGPHIQAVRKAMKEGVDFKQGDIITYIQTRSGSSISDRARIVDFVEEGDYDADYYVNNQVIPAVYRILEALGYSEDELKGLGRQTTLGDWK
ncbi:MAG: DNA-directed DNA polymerase [Candidatus Altiarchaeota archaeon]